MLDPWCGSNDIFLCNCLAFNGVPCRKSHGSFHSMSMVSYDLDTRKRKELDTTREIIWDTDRKGNRFIFDAQVVYKDSFENQSMFLCALWLTLVQHAQSLTVTLSKRTKYHGGDERSLSG